MNQKPNYREIFCRRLKTARLDSGLSQKSLGIAAGIDEFVASSRINRYEKGVHETDIETAQRLANVLNVPLASFYAIDDDLAKFILWYEKANPQEIIKIKRLLKF